MFDQWSGELCEHGAEVQGAEGVGAERVEDAGGKWISDFSGVDRARGKKRGK